MIKTSKKLTQKQKEKIRALYEKGLSQREIAEKIGCARSTVKYWLQK